SPRPDRLAPPVPTTSSTIFSGVEPGPPATDTAPDRHTRMPKSAAKRRQPRRLPPLTSPMKHRGELGSDPGEVAEGQCDTWCGCGHHRPLPWSAVGGESSELRPISNRIEDNPTSPERRVKGKIGRASCRGGEQIIWER